MWKNGWILTCALVFCCLGTPALADSARTDALIEQASAAYADLDFENALKLLYQAVEVPGNSRAQLVQIFHLTGLCLGALERYQIAEQAFARLLSLDPTFRLGTDVSPRIRKPFDQLVGRNLQRLEVRPLPPPNAEQGKPLVLIFRVVADPVEMIRSIRVFFKRGDAASYSSARTDVQGLGELRVTIPAPIWEGKAKEGEIAWYAVVEGDYTAKLQTFGDSLHPLLLEVRGPGEGRISGGEETVHWYERWWVWTLVATGVAAAATAGVLLIPRDPSGPVDFEVDFTVKTAQ